MAHGDVIHDERWQAVPSHVHQRLQLLAAEVSRAGLAVGRVGLRGKGQGEGDGGEVDVAAGGRSQCEQFLNESPARRDDHPKGEQFLRMSHLLKGEVEVRGAHRLVRLLVQRLEEGVLQRVAHREAPPGVEDEHLPQSREVARVHSARRGGRGGALM